MCRRPYSSLFLLMGHTKSWDERIHLDDQVAQPLVGRVAMIFAMPEHSNADFRQSNRMGSPSQAERFDTAPCENLRHCRDHVGGLKYMADGNEMRHP